MHNRTRVLSISLYNYFYKLDSCTYFIGNNMKVTSSILDIYFDVHLSFDCKHISVET